MADAPAHAMSKLFIVVVIKESTRGVPEAYRGKGLPKKMLVFGQAHVGDSPVRLREGVQFSLGANITYQLDA